MRLKDKKLAFIGDSITEGVGVDDASNLYWKLVADATGARCYGYGISGTRIAPQQIPSPEAREDAWFGSRINDMIPDADVVVVFGGTNDFGHGDVCFGDVYGRQKNSFCAAFHKLLHDLIVRYPDAQLVVMTPLHRLGEDDLGMNERGIRREYRLEDYVDAMITISGYYGIPVLDLYRISGMQPAVSIVQERYMPDGLHPNDAGHALIAGKIMGFLEI